MTRNKRVSLSEEIAQKLGIGENIPLVELESCLKAFLEKIDKFEELEEKADTNERTAKILEEITLL